MGKLVTAEIFSRPAAYGGQRDDLLALLPGDRKSVLDLGCNEGLLGLALKSRQTVSVTGAEIDVDAARVASTRLDDVFCGDLESEDFRHRMRGKCFDAVVCGDILEHLRDPWALLDFIVDQVVTPDAVFVISVPNVGHWSSLHAVWIRKTWPLNDRGIHDRSHLRWFTERDALALVEGRGLSIDLVLRKYRLFEPIHPWNGGRLERVLRPMLGSLLVHQILIRATMGGAKR